MPTKPITSLIDLIGRRFDSSGLQFAHIVGVQFYNSEILAWLRPLLNVNEDSNFTVLPESERGSAILGACNATTTAIVPANDNGTHAAREAA